MELWSFLDNSLQLQTLNFFHIKLYLTLSVIPSGKTKNNASFLCHSLIIVDTNKYKKIKKNMTQRIRQFSILLIQHLLGWSGYDKETII